MAYTVGTPAFIPVATFIPALVVALALLTATTALAAESPDPWSGFPVSIENAHVRTTDAVMANLLAAGLKASPLMRRLVDRLNDSDVVVYLKMDRRLPTTVEGQMTIVGQAGGLRYVVVSLAWGRAEQRRIATLGHELRHAVEVADNPGIVDATTLAGAYEEMGFPAVRSRPGVSFDTSAAVAAGERVWLEISDHYSGRITTRASGQSAY